MAQLARDVGISNSYMYGAVYGHFTITEKLYNEIKEKLNERSKNGKSTT